MYLAVDKVTKQKVAIKQMEITRKNRAEWMLMETEVCVTACSFASFPHVAQLHAKSSQHPNIVSFIDSFLLKEENRFWMVLEYIDGARPRPPRATAFHATRRLHTGTVLRPGRLQGAANGLRHPLRDAGARLCASLAACASRHQAVQRVDWARRVSEADRLWRGSAAHRAARVALNNGQPTPPAVARRVDIVWSRLAPPTWRRQK